MIWPPTETATLYKMFTTSDLCAFSFAAQRAAAQPALQDAKTALLAQPNWDDALLCELTQAFLGTPLPTASAESLSVALRRLRRAAIAALAELDLVQQASLETVTQNITQLADTALQLLLQATGRELAVRYGAPQDAQGQPIDVQVVAMGKHGGRELNVSSDIDIVFLARSTEGSTAGALVQGLLRTQSNREFLNQWARNCVSLMNAQTVDGFVFRVDTRLRPHGSAGPMVVEHAMLEDYLQTQGRMWERLAWLKARGMQAPVFETAAQHAAGHEAWQTVVQPFVYRRYLDFTVIDSLRELHGLIRAERRQFEAKSHSGLHVKLARGGIREIEFWVQGQQLVRAGRNPSLRANATLPALQALAQAGVIDLTTAQAMAAHYRLLRRAEHAVQYIDDAQTHVLPFDDAARHAVALAMGFATLDALDAALLATMNDVAAAFDDLFASVQGAEKNADRAAEPGAQTPTLSDAAQAQLAAALERVQALPVQDETRLAIQALLAQSASLAAEPFASMVAFILSISRRKTYLDVLRQHPPVLARLQQLMLASPFAAQYLQDHPALIDELIDARSLYATMDANYWQAERARLTTRLDGMDEETQLHVLREAHHAWVLRVLAQDVQGQLDVRAVSDALSQAADIALDAALCCVNAKLGGAFALPAGLGIVAYGKLGGKELGYGSDLDVVFIYDDALASEAGVSAAGSSYPRLVQRLVSWLSVQTAAGRLFEIDTALRPNGQSGLMLTSIAAFAEYQLGQAAGTHAWLWEHQALSRARLAAGDARLSVPFEALRAQVLCLARDEAHLKKEVIDMRQRVSQGHPVPADQFDAKHSKGGMVDIEFAVQYLVLRHAAAHPTLLVNVGNVALLNLAAQAGLFSQALANEVGQAYMALRTAQHHCKLQGQERAWVALGSPQAAELQGFAGSVAGLWAALGLV